MVAFHQNGVGELSSELRQGTVRDLSKDELDLVVGAGFAFAYAILQRAIEALGGKSSGGGSSGEW